MKYVKFSTAFYLSIIICFACSCNNLNNKTNENSATQTGTNNSSTSSGNMDSQSAIQNVNSMASDPSVNNTDTSAPAQQNVSADSLFSQMKKLTGMFGNNDSGILKNFNGGGNELMMKKLQSMMGGKSQNPGDAIGSSVLNMQLGQMKDNNPLKQVANEMMKAQQNGTAGPSKTFIAVYIPEQPANYSVPVSGNGNTIMLQYTGGTITGNKKDGLWKNICISANPSNKWNVYTEGYMESSAINMKIHSTSLLSVSENYFIILNEQYKKYFQKQRNELGKNEYAVQVQKIGNEKMFGYNCVHIRITYTVKALRHTINSQEDEWYSADVPGVQFLSPVIFESHSPVVVKKIMAAGCAGALVKSISKSSGSSQVIQLSGIIKKDMPGSIFTLPQNYQEDKNTSLYDIQ